MAGLMFDGPRAAGASIAQSRKQYDVVCSGAATISGRCTPLRAQLPNNYVAEGRIRIAPRQ
jgi:hypothetical protein